MDKLEALKKAAINYGEVVGGMATQANLNDLAAAAVEYYESTKAAPEVKFCGLCGTPVHPWSCP